MKICIWGNIANSLMGGSDGGGELQTYLLARTLAKSGHDVVIIDYISSKDFVTDEGIKVIHLNGWNTRGLKFIRQFTHQLPMLYSYLKAQKADLYYSQIRDYRHIISLLAARKVNGKFVIQLASDLDCSDAKLRFKYDYFTSFNGPYWFVKIFLTELLFPKIVRKADLVLAQHEGQKSTLSRKGIESIIFNNIIDLTKIPYELNPERKDFSYVGALDRRKGFAEFYELVTKCPNHTFKVIGAPRDKTGYFYFEKLKSFPNVKLYGQLNRNETLHHILNSKALVSTSPMEGFPNVFIEAWAYGIPVLSLYFDPGDIIKNEKLGVIANGNIDKLVSAMENLEYSEEFASRAKAHVENNHALNANKVEEINQLFNGIKNA
jgi:hypothetical protein